VALRSLSGLANREEFTVEKYLPYNLCVFLGFLINDVLFVWRSIAPTKSREGSGMSCYLSQATFKDTTFKALVERPQERADVVGRTAEAFGGKLREFFFAFGEFDCVFIAEFPDNESYTAFAMTLAAGGAASALRTTVLMEPAQAVRAMRKAGSVQSGYTPPTGEFQGGGI
jgi:uncharacterized protein with GYD domain